MREISPRILINGRDVDYLKGDYKNPGNLSAATISFSIPLTFGGIKKLWNKEVTMFLNKFDTTPIFRGWIKRTKPTFNEIQIIAEDALGYMIKGGEKEVAKIALDENTNLDGLTTGAAIKKALELAKLDTKLGTAYIGDTSPLQNSVTPPFRGLLGVLDIIKQLLAKSINLDSVLPKPNIAKLVDNGTISQIVIELESDLENGVIKHVYTEQDNIINLSIINRKVPTIVTVAGDGVLGTFTHDSAISAYDRNFLSVSNEALKSPAECRDFAQKLFQANLKVQYEYGIEVIEGAYLSENDVIRIETDDPKFSGNYRVIGKAISFSPNSFKIGLSINRKPPTLAEYISSRDN
jgi:hypothetical protein